MVVAVVCGAPENHIDRGMKPIRTSFKVDYSANDVDTGTWVFVKLPTGALIDVIGSPRVGSEEMLHRRLHQLSRSWSRVASWTTNCSTNDIWLVHTIVGPIVNQKVTPWLRTVKFSDQQAATTGD